MESNVKNIENVSSSETKSKGVSLEKRKQGFEMGEPNPIIGKNARKKKGKY